MTTIKAIRLASLVTAINVLVASGFSIAAMIHPQYLVPAESVSTEASLLLAMYAAAPRIPLALFVLGAIYKQATPALLILGALAGAMQLLDAGIGLFEHDLGKCGGPLFLAFLQFFVVYLLHKSVSITPQNQVADKRSIVVDGIGGEVLSEALNALALGGSLTTLEDSASRKTTIDVTSLVVPQASIRSLNMFTQPKAAIADAWNVIVSLLKSGAIKPIVAKTFLLAEAADALRYLVEGRPFGRVVLKT